VVLTGDRIAVVWTGDSDVEETVDSGEAGDADINVADFTIVILLLLLDSLTWTLDGGITESVPAAAGCTTVRNVESFHDGMRGRLGRRTRISGELGADEDESIAKTGMKRKFPEFIKDHSFRSFDISFFFRIENG
jgi:hypothetical protein